MKWHRYPEEKPTESGEYWVTIRLLNGERSVEHQFWYEDKQMFSTINDVIAWAKTEPIPKPYRWE